MSKEKTYAEITQKVDVVTTSTFGPMCSSGAFINFGHTIPPMRMEKLTLNDVPAYGGIAAVDAYIGATETAMPQDRYSGAHVTEVTELMLKKPDVISVVIIKNDKVGIGGAIEITVL